MKALSFSRSTGILLLGSSLILGFGISYRASVVDAFEYVLYDQGCTPSLNAGSAMHSLMTIASGEADYRDYDRDGNQLHDYWRGDVAGLYWRPDPSGAPLWRIELSVANADACPLSKTVGSPRYGYWFLAILHEDEKTPSPDRFAVCAFPDSRAISKYTFLIDENKAVYRKALKGQRGVDRFPADPAKAGWTRIN